MPPFHLIGVAKEDWSPFSLRINSLYSTSFVKYGFSVKPFNKTNYEKLGPLMVLAWRWNTEVSSLNHHRCDHFLFLSVSNILSQFTQHYHLKETLHLVILKSLITKRDNQGTYKLYSVSWFDVFKLFNF